MKRWVKRREEDLSHVEDEINDNLNRQAQALSDCDLATNIAQ